MAVEGLAHAASGTHELRPSADRATGRCRRLVATALGDRLTRAQYLALRDAGILTAAAAVATPDRLVNLLGVDGDAAVALTAFPAAA